MTTNVVGKIDAAAAASGGILSCERIVAKGGFSRWLVPPAALAIHLCIGMAYGFSVFWLPLSRSVGTATGTSTGLRGRRDVILGQDRRHAYRADGDEL
jgi:hypothetical protein